MPKIEASNVIAREGIEARKYFLVSAHREENVDSKSNLRDLVESLHALADKYEMPILVSTHPRTRDRLEKLTGSTDHALIRYAKPFGFTDYVALQRSAFCVLSDSGTITEESSLLGFPAITIRNAHERPEGMDEGTLIMSGLKSKRIIEAVEIVTNQQGSERVVPIVPDYQTGPVSIQVTRIVASYVDYVNRTIWHKH